MTKLCSKCRQIRFLDDFHKSMISKDGFHCWCKGCKKKYQKNYYLNNRDELKSGQKNYYLNNRDERKEYQKKYQKKNRKKINKTKNKYQKNRLKADICYKIAHNLRGRLYRTIKNNQKSGSAVRDLGCSISELKKHLELLFKPGMSWDNYGEWHIDHIIPLSRFDLTNSIEFKEACSYTNLQPLWASENFIKSNK